ncbi:MAG: hypothetical protein ACKOYK_07530 [Cyanobium sp.]
MTISPGEQSKAEAQRPGALRPWLLGLALLAVAATAERVVGLSAPMPTMEAPSSLRLAGYRVSALEGEPPRQGRELSHGQLRRFRLEPHAGGSPLLLSLLPMRSRTGTELSEGSQERKGLNLVAVAEQVPSFALNDRRLLSLPRPNGLAVGGKPDQIALGRGPKDPAGTITRLQTCQTPSGHAEVSASTLVGEERRANENSRAAALQRRLLRLAGIVPARHECLAVQVAGETRGERPLLAAWQDVQRVLLVP